MEKGNVSCLPSCGLGLLSFAVPIIGPAISVTVALANRSRYRAAPVVGFSVVIAVLQVVLVIAVILRSFFVASFYVPSDSMAPALRKGDLILVDQACFRLRGSSPQRGDIVIFDCPLDRKTKYVKRVVGLPGETLEIREGVLHVDGVAEPEPYLAAAEAADFGPIAVSDGECFVLTDNRNQGLDSRVWGCVPYDHLRGGMIRILWRGGLDGPPRN